MLADLHFNQVHPEGKFVVDLDKNIDINDVTANSRVALRSDSYTLHKILPNKVWDVLVSYLGLGLGLHCSKKCAAAKEWRL